MTQATLIAKVDSKVKQRAQQLAESFGLTLSGLVNVQLRNFIKTERLVIGNPEADETHRDYYKNNPDYVPVHEDIETVLDFLHKNIKKHEKTAKVSR